MAGTELKEVSSMKKGSTIVIDGAACKVTDVSISRPGKHGHAKVNLMAVGILDGKKRQLMLPGHDQVEIPIIDKRVAQVLSISGDTANIMDTQNYETFDLPIPQDVENGPVTEGCEVLYWEILGEKIIKQVKK